MHNNIQTAIIWQIEIVSYNLIYYVLEKFLNNFYKVFDYKDNYYRNKEVYDEMKNKFNKIIFSSNKFTT